MKKSLTVFHCAPLSAKLTVKACADRHVRARACYQTQKGGWTPIQWAGFVHSCRECPVGVEHAALLGTPSPAPLRAQAPTWLPKAPETAPQPSKPLLDPPEVPEDPPKDAAGRRLLPLQTRVCERCSEPYRPSGRRQKFCPGCSRAPRFVKLREGYAVMCVDCRCAFKPNTKVKFENRRRCAKCTKQRKRKKQNEWQREKRLTLRQPAQPQSCARCAESFLPKKTPARFCPRCRTEHEREYFARRYQARKARHQKTAWLEGDLNAPQ